MKNIIFTFGSNLAGIHGAGSAKAAIENCGAIYGLGVGPQGNSYAIPTKDCKLKTLPLVIIELYVRQFLKYAKNNLDDEFHVVAIGCGLAGYKPEQIAPMFKNATINVILTKEFNEILG